MKVIEKELERIANEICENYCKFKAQYTKEEWSDLMEDNNLPCDKCPLLDLIV